MLHFRGVREGLLGVVFFGMFCFLENFSNLTCTYSPLKINGWKLKFPLRMAYFKSELLASGSVRASDNKSHHHMNFDHELGILVCVWM